MATPVESTIHTVPLAAGVVQKLAAARKSLRTIWADEYEEKIEPIREMLRRDRPRAVEYALLAAAKAVQTGNAGAGLPALAAAVDVVEEHVVEQRENREDRT